MKARKILMLLLALTLAFTGCSSKKEGVVATVDGVDISQEKYDLFYGAQREQLVSMQGEEVLEQGQEHDEFGRTFGEVLRSQLLDNMIDNQVIINAAVNEGINVDEELESEVSTIIEASGQEYFDSMLEEMGIDLELYKELLRDNLLVTEFRIKKMDEIEISDEDIDAYYSEHASELEQVNSRHILVETLEEAENVIKRLEAGEDFAELAQELSLDTGSAVQGGETGFVPRGAFVPSYEEFIFSGEVGDVSEPIESDYGYHIIEILDKQDSLEASKGTIIDTLKEEELQNIIEKLIKKAKVKKYLDPSKEPESILKKLEEQKTEEGNLDIESQTEEVETENQEVEEPEEAEVNPDEVESEEKKDD